MSWFGEVTLDVSYKCSIGPNGHQMVLTSHAPDRPYYQEVRECNHCGRKLKSHEPFIICLAQECNLVYCSKCMKKYEDKAENLDNLKKSSAVDLMNAQLSVDLIYTILKSITDHTVGQPKHSANGALKEDDW